MPATAKLRADAAIAAEFGRMAQVCWSSATAAASAPEAHRAFVDRYVEARFYGNCNCNCGCPCQFEDLPTQGHCRGFEVMEIDRGHFGETDLAGLRSAVLCVWPRPIIEGRGEMQAIIGERATPAQRRALQTVLHGGETEAARTHWWVFHAMSDTVHPTLYRPMTSRPTSRP